MKKGLIITLATACLIPIYSSAKDSLHDNHVAVSNQIISEQRAMLAKNTKDQGFGPQAPRDIDSIAGNNQRLFNISPVSSAMNLCNIHFHKNAEHKGGEFTEYAGNGDGHGFQSGYKYSGKLNASELKPVGHDICPSKHSTLNIGDTIEVHYVYSTAQVKPNATLGACFNDAIKNPQLRVETQVYVLVNNKKALDFGDLTKYETKNSLYQAVNIPNNTGTPVQYAGSTTGPSYNEKGSPFQVTWSVRPNIAKVNIESVGNWCEGNIFNEDHAHAVRNLVINPNLIAEITH
jgi:hypothetical protein